MLNVKFRAEHPSFELPKFGSEGAACFDFRYCGDEDLVLKTNCTLMVPLGFSLEFDKGWELQLRPRSGLAAKHGVTMLNAPGTVDSDYRGMVYAILHKTPNLNDFDEALIITPGMRVCQGCFKPVYEVNIEMADEIGDTERGTGGLGSTGTH